MTRTVCIAVLCLIWTPLLKAQTPVSFEQAMAAYETGHHETARKAFGRMAEAGLTEAQFNLGVMNLNGQGGPVSVIEGGAWILLAATGDHEAAQQASRILAEQLDAEQVARIESKSEALAADHGRRQLLERHRPETCKDDCGGDDDLRGDFSQWPDLASDPDVLIRAGKPLRAHRQQPRYPADAVTRGLMGAVRLAGWINAEGHIEHPHVISSYPAGTFDSEALRAFSRWTFDWIHGPPEEAPVYQQQYIIFVLDTDRGQTLRALGRAARDAENDLAAAHRAIWLIETLGLHDRLEQPLAPDAALDVIFRAAVAGVPEARIDLARRFQRGGGVYKDRESARFWFMQAAMEGSAEAQFELSMFSELDDDFQRDLRRAAARSGMVAAILADIRDIVAHPQQADVEYLARVIDKLPRRYRAASGDPVMEQARTMTR